MAISVADLCQREGIELSQVIEQSGLEESRVQAILLGRWTPNPKEREKIAAVFGVPIDEIAWGHVTPIQHLYGHGPG